tara:strand:+ start:821 stop:1096 length:276 start_codon:yes stop_codon:yes gene_type:complete
MKKKKQQFCEKTKYPLYIVIWKDHIGDSSWKTAEEVAKEKHVLAHSIGYLLHQDKESVKLCNTYTSDKGYGGLDLILKSCIVEMYEIEINL